MARRLAGSVRDGYRWLMDLGFDPDRIRAYVNDRAGSLLPVGWPDGVFVQVDDVSRFTQSMRRWPAICREGEGR